MPYVIGHPDVTGYRPKTGHFSLITAWLDRYLDDFRNDGIDLDAAEDPVQPIPKSCLYLVLIFFLVVLGAGGALWLLQIARSRWVGGVAGIG